MTQRMEWQLIETVPKDGSAFLGYDNTEKAAVMYGFENSYGVFFWDFLTQGIEMHPTHWMPLPEDPNT